MKEGIKFHSGRQNSELSAYSPTDNQKIGYNLCHDEYTAWVMEIINELEQLILDTLENEQERNTEKRYHQKGYKISKMCSCSNCHISYIITAAIKTMILEGEE